ncbi:hypothetical protein J1N35_003569 [Gossypium stocksii]|uniref:Metallothionein-like protein n=1 Tax=Gossypium stocksii TaxID=47602 RepID=A0A9D4AGW2_9ROSI|nr:hypothetical protein J1N35_003569 [Gossypium stocksii]
MDMKLKDPKKTVNIMKPKGSSVACDETCGCPSPCPGGVICSCAMGDTSETDGHRRCSCGDHCCYNLCSCDNGVATEGGVDKAFYK